MNTKAKAKISELLAILGTVLFVGGTTCYLRGELLAEHDLGNRCSGTHLCERWCWHEKRRNSEQEE